jgi:aspartate aminotransferase
MEFLKAFYPNKNAKVWAPDPTWPTHHGIAAKSGFESQKYRYYDRKNRNFDCAGMLEDLDNAGDEQIVILHACAHNPTGQDPTPEQWKQILEVCLRRNHLVCFDNAYQGFASGDLMKDGESIRMFSQHTDRIIVFQSFAKNFGLYGERIGNLNVVCKDAAEAKIVQSRLKTFARPMYSNPPIHGAHIVNTILSDPALTKSWHNDLGVMSKRM